MKGALHDILQKQICVQVIDKIMCLIKTIQQMQKLLGLLKLKVIHFSFGSYLDLGKLFKAMFPNSEIAEQFL